MFRLLIATGQRREEVAGLDWYELDRKSQTWTLPAERAKNGQAHIVPLNALAVAELDTLATKLVDAENDSDAETSWPARGLVFTTTGKTAASGHSRGKSRLDKEVETTLSGRAARTGKPQHPIAAWRIHDVRRTVATGLQRLGIRFEVTEAVLNHVSGSRSGVAGVYQRHDWKEEKRMALLAWGSHLNSLISPTSGSNIYKLPTASRSALS
jgi:integrase